MVACFIYMLITIQTSYTSFEGAPEVRDPVSVFVPPGKNSLTVLMIEIIQRCLVRSHWRCPRYWSYVTVTTEICG